MRTKEQILKEIDALQQENMQIQKELDMSALAEQNEKEFVDMKTSNAEAAARGAIKGFTAGFDDEIAAGAMAIGDTIKETTTLFNEGLVKGLDNSLSAYAEHYRKNKQQYLKAQKKLEDRHPTSFNLGDIVGTAASFSLGPTPANAPQMLSKLASFGFMHGAGRSEAETLGGVIEAGQQGAVMEGSLGMAGELASPYVAKTIRGAADKVADWGAERFLTFLRGSSSSNKLNKYAIQDKLKEQKVSEWAEKVLNFKTKDNKYVLSPLQTIDDAIDRTKLALKENGDAIGKVINEGAATTSINVPQIHSSLTRRIADPLLDATQKTPEKRAAGQKIKKYIRDLFYVKDYTQAPTVTKDGRTIYPMTEQVTDLATLQQSKSDIFSAISKAKADNDSMYEKQLRTLAHELHEIIDDKVKKDLPEQYQSFRTHSEQYRDLVTLEQSLDIRARTSNAMNYAKNIFLQAMSMKTLGSVAAASMAGVSPETTGAVATSVALLAMHPSTNKMAAKGLTKLANGLKYNPELFSDVAVRVHQAALASGDAFEKEIMHAGATVDLTLDPLERTMDALILRKDSVLTVLNSGSPKLATKLDTAIRNKDEKTIGEIMSSIGTTRQMVPGLGFNGKVYTNIEKQKVMSWIKQNISNTRLRMNIEKKFRADSMVPEEMMDPERLKSKQRAFVKSPEYKAAKTKINKPEF